MSTRITPLARYAEVFWMKQETKHVSHVAKSNSSFDVNYLLFDRVDCCSDVLNCMEWYAFVELVYFKEISTPNVPLLWVAKKPTPRVVCSDTQDHQFRWRILHAYCILVVCWHALLRLAPPTASPQLKRAERYLRGASSQLRIDSIRNKERGKKDPIQAKYVNFSIGKRRIRCRRRL